MDDIRKKNYIYKFDDNDEEIDSLNFVKYMKIDINSEYICLVGKSKIMIIDIVKQKDKAPYEFDI